MNESKPTVTKLSTEEVAEIVGCETFLNLFQVLLKYQYKRTGRVNLSDFSRRCGFASRSYLSELMAGKKGLSRDSFKRIKFVLKQSATVTELLELLAYVEMPLLRPAQLTDATLESRIHNVRKTLRQETAKDPARKPAFDYVSNFRLQLVFASLGSLEKGATPTEVVRRTKLDVSTVRLQLRQLVKHGLATRDGERYYPDISQLDTFGLSSREGLSVLIGDICEEIKQRRKALIDDTANSVVYSVFSISSQKLPELQKKLKEAIFGVLDQYQDDDGNSTKQLMYSLF